MTAETTYVHRRLDPPASGDKLAGDIDQAIRQLAAGRELVGVALAPITAAGYDIERSTTAGMLITAILRGHQ